MNIQESFSKLAEKLGDWIEQLVLLLPNFLVAVMVLVVFWFLAKLVKKLALRILNRFVRSEQVGWLAALTLYIVTLAAGLIMALGVLGLDKTVSSLLTGAGIVGLAVALAFQDLGKNVLAGIYLAMRRTIRPGDIIEVQKAESKSKGHFGTVKTFNLRSTHINTPQGQIVVIPNKEVFENAIIIYSTGHRRVDLNVGVSYGDELAKVRRVAIEAVKGVSGRIRDRDIELFFEEFADSSINFVVRFWIDFKKQTDFLQARSEAIERIKAAFDENGITIPFPIRTLDFSVVGGETLSDMLEHTDLSHALKSAGGRRKHSHSGHDH